MRNIPSTIQDIWNAGGPFIGDKAAHGRVTVEIGWNLNTTTSTWGACTRGPYRWWQRADNSQVETEVPNVSSIQIDRGLDADAGTCTIELKNQWMVLNNGTGVEGSELGKPGYFTWNRGASAEARARWGHQANVWENVLRPNALLRTYQGYGGKDKTLGLAITDGNLVLTGVWLVDEVRITARGTISLRCRDMAKLLIDQPLFPPLIPGQLYPLTYQRFKWTTEKIQGNRTPGSAGGGANKRTVYRTSSSDKWYGYNASIHGHRPTDCLDASTDTFALSVGNSHPSRSFCTDYWEFDVGEQINGFHINPWAGNYEMYVSVMENGVWVDAGLGRVPYDHNPLCATQRCVNTGANELFVMKVGLAWETPTEVRLPRAYNADRIRITFRNHTKSQWGPWYYRAGIRHFVAKFFDTPVQGVNDPDTVALYRSDGNYCVDTETEILTPRGWLRYDEVQVGDEGLALDPETGTAGWEQITNVFREHRQTRMVAMSGRYHDSLSTPDHRWLTQNRQNKWAWKVTDTLNTASRIPTAAFRHDAPTTAKFSDDFVEVIAWFYTEGSLSDGRGCLSQSRTANPGYAARIEGSLRRLYGQPGSLRKGYLWNETVNPTGTSIFRVSHRVRDEWTQVAPDRVPSPEFLCSLTPAQLLLFMETSVDADGHRRLSNGTVLFAQKDERRIRAFEMACVLAGRTPNTTRTNEGWSCTVRRGNSVAPCAAANKPSRMTAKAVQDVDYDGVIWCPTLRHHNWLARRNGKVYFTGNTDYADIIKELLLWAGFLLYDPAIAATSECPVYGNIESTGIFSEEILPREMFDKKPIINAITELKQIVGYIFWVDDEGAARWESPNWWEDGNFYDTGEHTEFIPEIDERLVLTDYTATFMDRSARSEIIISSNDPTQGNSTTITTNYIPTQSRELLHGMVRPAMWVNGYFSNKEEQQVMAELVALHMWFAERQGQVSCVANPAIQINDQVRIFERQTAETYIHYVRGVSTSMDIESGSYTMTLTTHWLGDQNQWAISKGDNDG